MTARLRSGDDFVRVVYDFKDAVPIKQDYYLMSPDLHDDIEIGMSRISLDGQGDVMFVPKKGGEMQRPWGQTGFIPVKAEELTANYLAVRNNKTTEFLAVGFKAPGFSNLSLSSGSNGFNYMLFDPVPNTPPGKATFLLGAGKGGWDAVKTLGQGLAAKAEKDVE